MGRRFVLALILFVALDVVVIALLGLIGIPGFPDAQGVGLILLAAALALASMALLGAASILATDFRDNPRGVAAYELDCLECGRAPDVDLAFCPGCGAAA